MGHGFAEADNGRATQPRDQNEGKILAIGLQSWSKKRADEQQAQEDRHGDHQVATAAVQQVVRQPMHTIRPNPETLIIEMTTQPEIETGVFGDDTSQESKRRDEKSCGEEGLEHGFQTSGSTGLCMTSARR